MGSKRKSIEPSGRSKPSPRKPAETPKRSSSKSKKKPPAKASKPARPVAHQTGRAVDSKKLAVISKPAEAPRLLRETKGTTAALVLLEKGIKLIYQKEFKKARLEFKSLVEGHPAEPEILARARTYLQICEREESALKKHSVSNDQLYNMGVMEHNRGDYDKAIVHFRHSLDKNPGSDHIYYALAASLAMKGESGESLHILRKAVELNEENRVYAKNDSDFALLHELKEFGDLVGWVPPVPGGHPVT